MVELLCPAHPTTGHFARFNSRKESNFMNLVLSPMNGKFKIKATCLIRDDMDCSQDVTGIGTAELSPAELVQLFRELQAKLGETLQHWAGPENRRATLTLLYDGTWSVWSGENVPNIGPLRTQDDYNRQIRLFRNNGMRPEVQNGSKA